MSWREDRRVWELPHLREAHQMPVLDCALPKSPDLKPTSAADFWSVKFYPYTRPGVDPVFAVIGGKRILICRPPSGKDNSKIDIVREILDEDNDIDNFACAWTKDAETDTPLLCVGGGSDQLKIFNAVTGKLLRTLSGHGGEINDIAVSPINPDIIASASEDCTVRIWSLDPRHANQPCAAILEGDSHEETILCLAFHATGRYLLSGGIDHRINLWTLPEFPDANTGKNIPTRIYYPHFSTSEIHGDIVDCVSWWGDLIFSKALKEHSIVLWSITNFNSKLPPPPRASAPTTHSTSHRPSRSAFVPSPPSAADNAITLFTRHLELSIPESHIMFTRFGLFPGHKKSELGRNPVIAFCNTNSKVFFFDLARLENYWDIADDLPGPDGRRVGSRGGGSSSSTCSHVNSVSLSEHGHGSKKEDSDRDRDLKSKSIPTDQTPRAHPFLLPFQRRNRGGGTGAGALARLARETSLSESTGSEYTNQDEASQAQSSSHNSTHNSTANSHSNSNSNLNANLSAAANGKGKIDWARSREGWSAKYEISDPLRELEPHHTEMVKGIKFVGRQVAWSNDGMWCVVVGSGGSIGVLGRWDR
ncbi:WD40-repeat-containing domain protein [Leptodontidium sp. MPI-SDFR-AT-0119]|nr:WD40-repeat-containing domain protein [Leptodontidium sp. MPI-SDFR-AT-0119]